MLNCNSVRIRALLVVVLVLLCAGLADAANDDTPLWLRYPAISPDGTTVLFSYHGDIYTVPTDGGLATPLTRHEAHDTRPVWSPDGKSIAFASDRYGNWDLFLMSVEGGNAHRLTHHTSPDTPCGFTPDGAYVLFNATRMDGVNHAEFPHYRATPELYKVSIDGGRPEQVLTIGATQVQYTHDEKTMLYSEQNNLENIFRKHNRSAFSRDIWMLDVESNNYSKLTDFEGGDWEPTWDADETGFFFLSDRSGDFNIWHLALNTPDQATQITSHQTHPVRFLTSSRADDLCYSFDGEIYIKKADTQRGQKIPIMIRTEDPSDQMEFLNLSKGITSYDLSPTGQEIVFVNRGEIFVTSVEHKMTKRITNTSTQERSVSFSPDGRSLLYAGERNGSWNLYRTDLKRDEEPYFFSATLLDESPVLEVKAETYQPSWSPDGLEVAYLQERVELKVLNLKSGKTRTVLPADRNYSYSDGDQWYDWSPDGQWFLVNFLSAQRWSSEVGLVSADGKNDVVNLTRSGYEDGRPLWAMDGKMMMWFSDRNGLRDHGGWRTTDDVFGMFFTQETWDRYHLSEAELAVADALKDEDEKKNEDKDKDENKDEDKKDEQQYPAGFKPKELPDPLKIELTDIQDRVARLTIHASSIAGAVMTDNGEQLIYLTRFEKGLNLWSYKHRKAEIKLLAKLDARRAGGLKLDAKGKNVFLLADGQIKKVEVESGKPKGITYSATVELNAAAERDYMFGVDWKGYKKAYAKFLPWINNNHDFAEMLSEMLGELNASHTGSGYRPRYEGADATASLGAFFDPSHSGDGLKILEVIAKGPLVLAKAGIKAGMVIDRIDDVKIKAGENYYPLLNRKAGKQVLLSITDPDGKGDAKHLDVVVKPIRVRALGNLLYDRWIENRRAETDRLSGGRLGYVHVRGMNSRSYRDAFADIMGRYSDKEGLVVDTRFNSGGNLAEFLADFLNGHQYAMSVPRGQKVGIEPSMSWSKPSIVIQNEGNYSDAHIFPFIYKEYGIGKLVGTQVPGTGTAVWWETLQDPTLYFGIPEVGFVGNDGRYLENTNLEPDVWVDNEPAISPTGRDQQLETAVKVLLNDMGDSR
jgi:Tol biopolymer transport system component/C-terminal processing protease CtpA/Prc